MAYGLIPEIIGRLPVVCSLTELDKEALKTILTEPKNALVKQYQHNFRLEEVDLVFEDAALDAVVELALKRGTGARALRSIMETAMTDLMYSAPSIRNLERCAITRDFILNGAEPEYVYKQKRKRA